MTQAQNPLQIVIIAGPNGAGKSTLAPILLRDQLGLLEFVNADTIAAGLSGFRPEAAALEAGRIVLKRMRELAARKQSFAFETTLATRSYANWLVGLKQDGYQISLLYVWLQNDELARQRVQQRVAAGGHDIPAEIIRRRYSKGVRNFFSLYQPLADEWGVYDNSAAGAPRLIASGHSTTSQQLILADLWAKFCEVTR